MKTLSFIQWLLSLPNLAIITLCYGNGEDLTPLQAVNELCIYDDVNDGRYWHVEKISDIGFICTKKTEPQL